jgi:hypothetical protein
MQQHATIYTAGDFVRRVADSLLGGQYRGKFLCARCLVKLTKSHLDKSYGTREIEQVLDDVFTTPGSLTLAPRSQCAACARRNLPCLGVPVP